MTESYSEYIVGGAMGSVFGDGCIRRIPVQPARAALFSAVCLAVILPGFRASNASGLPLPVTVSAGTQSLTVPWHLAPVDSRWNPAVTVGTDRPLRSGDRTILYHTANVGFFQHYWWMTGLFINTEIGAGYKLPGGFHADLKLGLGYLHYFWRRESLELRDGRYVHARDWGRPAVMVPLSLILGYLGSHDSPMAAAPFIAVQWAVQAPFADETPAMTHFFLLVGVRFNGGRTVSKGGM